GSTIVTQDKNLPTITATGGQITCLVPTITVSATATPNTGVSYVWTVPAGVTNPGSVASFTTTTPGTYSVTVTVTATGCTASTTATVTEDKSAPTVNITGGQITCLTPTITVSASATPNTGVTYTWTVPAGVTAPGNVASFTTTVAGTYSVTVTKENGCYASSSTVVTEDKTAPTVIVSGGQITCAAPTVTVSATATPNTGVSYAWTVPAGVTNPGSVASFTTTVPGTYSVTVTKTSSGCTVTGSTIVTQDKNLPTITATGGKITCLTPTITVSATATPNTGVTYVWTVPAGVTNPGSVASFTTTTPGTYSVTV
ncbi:hypothetical protein GVN16_25900, partial [Emticicia sp. CRIBPO]|nr:hypothetical protein [Emticicia sp. CRIBPO]